jgi:hypothetical protein
MRPKMNSIRSRMALSAATMIGLLSRSATAGLFLMASAMPGIGFFRMIGTGNVGSSL